MTWQIAISAYIVLATAAYLLRRQLALSIPGSNRIINGIFFITFLYPIGLVVAWFSHPNLAIGWDNFIYTMIGSMVFPVVMVAAFSANKHIDAGVYTILNNLTPVVAILGAYVFLAERLSLVELVGSFIIISSAFLASAPKLKHHAKSDPIGIYLALLSVALLGVGIVFEKWMLGRIDFGAYLVYGWGAQTFWMAVLAWPERKQLKIIKRSKDFNKVVWYGVSNALKGLCFVSALKLSSSAALVSAFSSFLAVIVVLAAYFIINEKEYLWLKISAALMGAAGIILINL